MKRLAPPTQLRALVMGFCAGWVAMWVACAWATWGATPAAVDPCQIPQHCGRR
jgi:hypothetical protein